MEYVYFMSISLAIISLYLVVSFYKQNKLKESFQDCVTDDSNLSIDWDDGDSGDWSDNDYKLWEAGDAKCSDFDDRPDKCAPSDGEKTRVVKDGNKYKTCKFDNDDGDDDYGNDDYGDDEECPNATNSLAKEKYWEHHDDKGCDRLSSKGQEKCEQRHIYDKDKDTNVYCEWDDGECKYVGKCHGDDGDGDDGDGDDGGGGNNNGATTSSADPVYISNHNAPQCPEENGGNCPGRRSTGAGTAYPGESRTNYRGSVCYYQYGGNDAKCSDIDKKDKCSTKIRTGDGAPSYYTDGVEPERTGRYVVDSNGVRTYCEWDNENDVCGEYHCTTTEPEVHTPEVSTVVDDDPPYNPYEARDADDIDHSTSNNWNEKCKTQWGSPDAWEGGCESITDAEQCKTGNVWVLDKNGKPYLCEWNPENEKCMNKESCFLGTVNLDYKNGLKSVSIGGTSVFNGCDSFEDEDEKLRCQLALSQEKMHI